MNHAIDDYLALSTFNIPDLRSKHKLLKIMFRCAVFSHSIKKENSSEKTKKNCYSIEVKGQL